MANHYHVKMAARGDSTVVAEMKDLLDQHTSVEGDERITRFSRIFPALDGPSWGWCDTPEEPPEPLLWLGECRGGVPYEFAKTLSLKYPVTEIAFTVTEPHCIQTETLKHGEGVFTYELCGCFEFKRRKSYPVHHYKFDLLTEHDDVDERVTSALRVAGMAFDGATRLHDAEIVEWLRNNCPNDNIELSEFIPYTICEDAYLFELHQRACDIALGGTELSSPPLREQHLALMQNLERNIELSDDEHRVIADGLLAKLFRNEQVCPWWFYRTRFLRANMGEERHDQQLHNWHERFGDRVASEHWELLQRWLREADRAAVYTRCFGPFRPIQTELEMLLEPVQSKQPNAERVGEITEAITRARWISNCPEWELLVSMDTGVSEIQEAGQSLGTDDEPDEAELEEFLADLQEFAPRREQTNAGRIDWQRDGF